MSDNPPSLDEMIAAVKQAIDDFVMPGTFERYTTDLDHAAALRAALAQLEASRWRPIETAPKDGTDILVNDGDVTAIAAWAETFWAESWTGLDFNVGGRQPAIRWCLLLVARPSRHRQRGE